MKFKAVALITLTLSVITVSFPQTPSAKKPEFEVASVKANTSGEGAGGIGDQPGGRFVASRVILRRVIQFAYRGNQDFIGGPDWIDGERWDIEARAAEGAVPARAGAIDVTKPDTLALMVQSLLEDRFKFKAHQETRELPLFNLTLAKGGPKIKLSEDQTAATTVQATGAAGGVPGRGGLRLGRGLVEGRAQPIEVLATALGALSAGRPVIDKTELKGLYDFRLQWTPDPPPNAGQPATTPSGPSLFTALEERLGLKLESGKGPLPVLVIDSIERPSPN